MAEIIRCSFNPSRSGPIWGLVGNGFSLEVECSSIWGLVGKGFSLEVECSSIWGLVGNGFFFLLNLITKLHCSRVTATSMEVCYGTKLREAYRV